MPRIAREITRFTKKEIDTRFQSARRALKHPALDILIAPKQKDFGRILIIASRKVGDAPTRNKIRRRLKSIFYEEKLYEYGYDCAVIVKPEGTTLSFDELKDILVQLFEKENK